ncbi:DUF3487 family protein [Dictyobacter arantiisoli]|uniref:PrgI family protein n=1 Tax=Dictyobacter arantiisoli TaxID=2014874 RepID=A0A5A5T722_9CHLR|nr:DUF3487 family protein [Dictyobacter arantiisoli]GCF06803.1 hypothetical protein KDI_03670 [Dictyobacter arantiisoli]
MKKEEFPTFLNQQPTVVFGRTGRELLIFCIGLGLGFMIWTDLRLPATGVGVIVLKAILAVIPMILCLIVAFVKVSSRPLEDWAVVLLLYIALPKVYLYMPLEENDDDDDLTDAYSGLNRPINPDDDDRYN